MKKTTGWLLWAALLAASPAARADRPPPGLSAVSLPVPAGVAGEVKAVLNAPAERVAELASTPADFAELFPADEVRVVGQRSDAVLIAVRKREAWPVGELRWVEAVKRGASGATLTVTRDMVESRFFRRMHAVLQVQPLPPDAAGAARCAVDYRVDVELFRWAPAWALRRSQLEAMTATVVRLQRMSERGVDAGGLGAVRKEQTPSYLK